MKIDLLYDNCRETWPKAVCAFANVCGYISCIIWLVVLVPQIWKNRKRRSVEGLSILWATANFTASLVNGFFAFSVSLPVYIRVLAVYMPILEFAILVQFWLYSKHALRMKLSYPVVCFLIWIAVIMLELFVADAAENVQWLAIVLWSIELFPQIILNMRLRTTDGQSPVSVELTLVGKTTDFLATYLLLLPLQNVVMIYFSSTTAFINGIQVIWYLKLQPKTYSNHRSPDEDALEVNDCEQVPLTADEESSVEEVDRGSVDEMASVCTFVGPNFESLARLRDIPSSYRVFLLFLLLAEVVFSVCICVNTKGALGIFAPVSVAVVLFGAFLYRNYREGRLQYVDSAMAWLNSCCTDQPVQSTWLTRDTIGE
ncbi:hypothetical protein AWC38_SpisGene19759 [Stylophora pistillata]|uniref:Uncharacterized protein n=1 Tax=Stylophora pistillata TaxID=50429 RepID=A0A2B4RI11_STYPI|nr:hypothetical protein AWC38_SpisGene19759 [Stylophora pistillata]